MSAGIQTCAPQVSAGPDHLWRLGPDVVVQARGVLLRHAIDTVFGSLGIEAVSAAPKSALTFELKRLDRGRLRVYANGLPIVSLSDELELAPVLEGTLIGCAVRKRRESAALHAACVELSGAGVLLAGGKGSGKSTLALALASRGARYLGDEIAFVRYEDASVEAFPKAVTLKEGSFPLFPEVTTYLDPVRGPIRYHRPANPAALAHRAPIGLLVLPTWTGDQEGACVSEVPAGEVALELIRDSFGGLERDRRMLSLVRKLAQVPAFRLDYGDTQSAVKAIEKLLVASRASD